MLAIRTGISSGYISQIMCGTRNPSPVVRQKLQDILQPLTFDDIFIIEENGKNDSQSK
jgi:transcriptional regulator with XRE-family HTH domain